MIGLLSSAVSLFSPAQSGRRLAHTRYLFSFFGLKKPSRDVVAGLIYTTGARGEREYRPSLRHEDPVQERASPELRERYLQSRQRKGKPKRLGEGVGVYSYLA